MSTYINIHSHHAGVFAATLVNCSPDTIQLALTENPDGFFSVGIHPWHIPADFSSQMELVREAALHSSVMAIGETGLDKVCDTSFELQKEVFRQHIALAEKERRPLILHCVKAIDELLEIKKETISTVPWILHGFRGKLQQAEQLLAKGCYLSFGIKYPEETLRTTPLDKLFLETDEADKDIRELYRETALLLGISEETLCERIATNFQAVFLGSCFAIR